jgi:hypothetical protein
VVGGTWPPHARGNVRERKRKIPCWPGMNREPLALCGQECPHHCQLPAENRLHTIVTRLRTR